MDRRTLIFSVVGVALLVIVGLCVLTAFGTYSWFESSDGFNQLFQPCHDFIDIFIGYSRKPGLLGVKHNIGAFGTKSHAAALRYPHPALPTPVVNFFF